MYLLLLHFFAPARWHTATRRERTHRMVLSEIVPVRVPNLRTKFPPSRVSNLEIASDSQGGATHYTKLIGEDDVVIYGEGVVLVV